MKLSPRQRQILEFVEDQTLSQTHVSGLEVAKHLGIKKYHKQLHEMETRGYLKSTLQNSKRMYKLAQEGYIALHPIPETVMTVHIPTSDEIRVLNDLRLSETERAILQSLQTIPTTSLQISEKLGLSPKTIRPMCWWMKRKGLIITSKGPSGGYALTHNGYYAINKDFLSGDTLEPQITVTEEEKDYKESSKVPILSEEQVMKWDTQYQQDVSTQAAEEAERERKQQERRSRVTKDKQDYPEIPIGIHLPSDDEADKRLAKKAQELELQSQKEDTPIDDEYR